MRRDRRSSTSLDVGVLYDTAKLLMAEAGLDERKWAARCSKPFENCSQYLRPI